MNTKRKMGKVYEFCASCSQCPVAIEADINGQIGLEIKDDFGGSVKLTDGNLQDFKIFLEKRFGA